MVTLGTLSLCRFASQGITIKIALMNLVDLSWAHTAEPVGPLVPMRPLPVTRCTLVVCFDVAVPSFVEGQVTHN